MSENPQKPYRSPWLYETEPFELVEGVYYVGNTSVSVHLFDTGEGLLLLDTGYGQTAYLLTESIRELGFNPRDVRWILHSHAHIDHFGATRMLVEKYHCKTYLPAADQEFLTTKAEFNWCEESRLFYEPPYDYYFEPDVLVCPGDVLQFGEIMVECYDAAGHTPGTMAYLFHLPSGLTAGMHGGVGLNTLTAEYAARFGLGASWREAFVKSMEALRGLKVDVVLGNHPRQTGTFEKRNRLNGKQNPFIDPTEWDRFLEQQMENYRKMVRKDPIGAEQYCIRK